MVPTDDFDPRMGDLPELPPYVPGQVVDGDSEKLEYDFDLDAAMEYELEVIEKGIREQAEDRARTYLSQNGDAVWERIERSLHDAKLLLDLPPGSSLVLSMTAAEL